MKYKTKRKPTAKQPNEGITYPEPSSNPTVLRETMANTFGSATISYFGSPLGDLAIALERIQNGIPFAEFEELATKLGLTQEEMARKIGISIPTLFRRRTANRPLDSEHSDRLMRFQRLFELTLQLFDGNEQAAADWLRRPEPALGYLKPLDAAETEAGAREVEKIIGRLEYGELT